MIIDEINRRHVEYIRARYPDNIDTIIENNLVHMARLAIVGSHSVNGVARIHSDIKKRLRHSRSLFFWMIWFWIEFYERSILVRVHSTIVAEEIVSNAPLSLSPTNACVTFNSDAAVKIFADVKFSRAFGNVVIRVSPSANE